MIGSPVAGLRPIRAFRFCTTSFTMPGRTNSPDRFNSFSHNAASSSKNSRACVRLVSNRSRNVRTTPTCPSGGLLPCLVPLGSTARQLVSTATSDRARVRPIAENCRKTPVMLARVLGAVKRMSKSGEHGRTRQGRTDASDARTHGSETIATTGSKDTSYCSVFP